MIRMKKEINDEKRCEKGERSTDRSQVELVPHRGNQKIMKQSLGFSHFQDSITVFLPPYVPK